MNVHEAGINISSVSNPHDTFPSRCRRFIRLMSDRFVDWHLGVDTLSGAWTAVPEPGGPLHTMWVEAGARQCLTDAPSRYGDSKPNTPIGWLALRVFVDRTELGPEDVFYDIGCGNGRVLCHVAVGRVSKCIGVELSPEFASKARANAKSLSRRLSAIDVLVGDAADMDYRTGTVFFLFNPFGAETLRSLVARIEETLKVNPRRVRIIYANPVHRDVLNSTAWLTFAGERRTIYSGQVAAYWTNRP
jgi:SAM-dependent methyltransferase